MFKLRIITPIKVLFEHNVFSVTTQTHAGEITILDNHMDMLSVLKPGTVKINLKNDLENSKEFFLFGGILYFDNRENTLLILADEAKTPSQDLIVQIEKAIKLAKEGKPYGIKVPVDALLKAEKELRAKFISKKGF